MTAWLAVLLSIAAFAAPAAAPPQPADAITYAVVIDPARPTEVSVTMRIASPPKVLELAMAVHPEYDDRFYRYIRDVRVSRNGEPVDFERVDSTLWRVAAGIGPVEVRYRVEVPGADRSRGSWRGFLTPTGGLIGGPHTFMYVVGRERMPAVVTLELPNGWKAVSGLAALPAYTFGARSAAELIDSPIMVGRFALSSFTIANVPHQIVWWDSAGRATVDPSVARTLEGLARDTHELFGAFPYRSFVFLIVGGVGNGGLEHRSSVSLAAPTDSTHAAAADFTEAAAHEYFHAWNEMALRPRGWGGLSHAAASPNRLTWWMEGATMYYADLVARRSHAPVRLDDRRAQLELWLTDYVDNPGNLRISPESASVTSNIPGTNGNFAPDVYTQGRLIAAALDLYIRERTDDARSLDDAMRALYRRRADSGYSATDVANAIGTACRCDAEPFLARYVRSAHPVQLDDVLARLGWRVTVRNVVARDSAGASLPDNRVFAYVSRGESSPRILIVQPEGAWARAGLRTGDVLLRINGDSVATSSDFRRVVRGAHLGDTAQVQYMRAGSRGVAHVKIAAYERAQARIDELPSPSAAQLKRRQRFQNP